MALPDSSVHQIRPARILEYVAMPSSREIFPTRDGNHIFKSFASGIFTTNDTWALQNMQTTASLGHLLPYSSSMDVYAPSLLLKLFSLILLCSLNFVIPSLSTQSLRPLQTFKPIVIRK